MILIDFRSRGFSLRRLLTQLLLLVSPICGKLLGLDIMFAEVLRTTSDRLRVLTRLVQGGVRFKSAPVSLLLLVHLVKRLLYLVDPWMTRQRLIPIVHAAHLLVGRTSGSTLL